MENLFEEQVKEELKSMDQRLYDMEEKIGSIDTKLTQVVDAILGNPLTKTGGFVSNIDVLEKKIEQLEKKVEKHEDFKKKVYWAIAILAGLLLTSQYISTIYSNIKG
jgi:tetrahydromethanopterin S-methyltransferase subunit G